MAEGRDGTDITIMHMTAGHITQIARIEEKLFSAPWSVQAFLDTLVMENVLFYTAVADDGTVAGYCGIYLAADEGEITNVAVDLPYQRRKIGEALLSRTMESAHAKGAQQLFLEVRSLNEPAIQLYQKAGFYRIGIRENYYQYPQDDALVMMYKYADI